MGNNVAEKNSHGQDQWWFALQLIAGLDATPTQKYLLTLVHRHTNKKTGRAWASQETLAWEMNVDDSTVERVFRWGKQTGIICVERVRKAKSQHNFYWLDVERMKELQREHPAPMRGVNGKEHPAPMTGARQEHPAPVPPSTPHQRGRAPRTHAGEGFEVSGNEKAYINIHVNSRALHSARKRERKCEGIYENLIPKTEETPALRLGTQAENRPRVVSENLSLAEPAEPFDFPSTLGQQQHLREEADQHGWTRQELKEFIKKEFGVPTASRLTHRQYRAALRFIEESVPLPPGLRNLKVR